MSRKAAAGVLVAAMFASTFVQAEGLDAKIQAKVDAALKDIQTLAADAGIVDAVKKINEAPSADAKAMTQEKWKELAITDALVRGLASNPAAKLMKEKKSDLVTEMFLSASDGTKVAFLSKPSNWSHKGKAKHDDPMAGKTWQGQVEVDESTGAQQIQIAVPVKDGDKVIGSLVVGLNVTKMKE